MTFETEFKYFFNRHSTTIDLVKEKQKGPIPKDRKGWPLKHIKRVADTGEVLLVFRHLPQVQPADVLWTFSIKEDKLRQYCSEYPSTIVGAIFCQ